LLLCCCDQREVIDLFLDRVQTLIVSTSINISSRRPRTSSRLYITTMATTRSLSALARTSNPLTRTIPTCRFATPAATFSTSSRKAALPSGPPPAGFRIPKPTRWDSPGQENALDKASKYFLMTEMARGMWVLMEQFFRPP